MLLVQATVDARPLKGPGEASFFFFFVCDLLHCHTCNGVSRCWGIWRLEETARWRFGVGCAPKPSPPHCPHCSLPPWGFANFHDVSLYGANFLWHLDISFYIHERGWNIPKPVPILSDYSKTPIIQLAFSTFTWTLRSPSACVAPTLKHTPQPKKLF